MQIASCAKQLEKHSTPLESCFVINVFYRHTTPPESSRFMDYFIFLYDIKSDEAVSKFKLQSKNNIPPSDATKEQKDMEPLFLLLLRRFHVPA